VIGRILDLENGLSPLTLTVGTAELGMTTGDGDRDIGRTRGIDMKIVIDIRGAN